MQGQFILDQRYRLDIEIGRGPHGRLFRATDIQTGRTVACKWLDTAVIHLPDFAVRWDYLLHTAASLSHPAIATLLDANYEEGQAYLITTWAEPQLTSIQLPPETRLAWGVRAAETLAYAQQQGAGHGRLHAGNLLWLPTGLFFTDFGLSALDEAAPPTAAADAQALAAFLHPFLATDPATADPALLKQLTTVPWAHGRQLARALAGEGVLGEPGSRGAEVQESSGAGANISAGVAGAQQQAPNTTAEPEPEPEPQFPSLLTLTRTELMLAPGQTEAIHVELRNPTSLVVRWELQVQGLPVAWATLGKTVVQLLPEERTAVTLTLHPPRAADTHAGQYPFQIMSQAADLEPAVANATLHIEPVADFAAELRPQLLTNKGVCQITVRNQGNAPFTCTIAGRDAAAEISFGEPQTIQIPAAEVSTAVLTVAASQRPWIGDAARLPFAVQITPAVGEPQTLQGQIAVQPRLPTWVLPVASALLVLMCTLGLFLSTRYVGRRQDATSTAVAAGIRLMQAVTPSPTAAMPPTLTPIPTLTVVVPATAEPTLPAIPTPEEIPPTVTAFPTFTPSPTIPIPVTPTLEGGGEEEATPTEESKGESTPTLSPSASPTITATATLTATGTITPTGTITATGTPTTTGFLPTIPFQTVDSNLEPLPPFLLYLARDIPLSRRKIADVLS